MKTVNRICWGNAGLAAAYAITARLGLLLAFPETNATSVWLPTGLALGAVLRWGHRLWPGIALGAFLANLHILSGLGWSLPVALAASGGTAAGNTLEALIGAYLIRRFAGVSNPFGRSHHVFLFVACGAFVSTAVSATVGTATFCLSTAHWADWWNIWLTWWLGDVVGALVVVPLLVTWQPFDLAAVKKRRAAETLLLVAGIFAVSWVVFACDYPMNFLLVLILMVAVFRLGQFGSAAVVFILCIVFTFSIARGLGTFAGLAQQGALLLNQGFIGVVAIATMVLAAILKERKVADEKLRASEQQNRLIMENLADLVAVLDLDGRRLYCSPSYGTILGDPGKLRGSSFFAQIYPEDEVRVRAAFQDTVRTGTGHRLEYRMVDRRGWPRRIESQGSVIRDASGQVAQVVVVSRDITERRQAEEEVRRLHEESQRHAEQLECRVAERTAELQDTQSALMNMVEDLHEKTHELAVAKSHAEESDRLKSAFLATMSHELRTPLNSIIGFTGIILQGLAGPLNTEQRKQLEIVRDSARHLLALINDVLDISKIEAGQLEVHSEPFDLRASIGKVIGIVKPMAEHKNLALRVELSPEIGTLESDPRRVEQVLLNLINNAIKFTERGSVTLTAEIAPDTIRLSVADTGIGIKPEDFGTLFKPFRQIDTGLSRQHEGTGLGLAICRRLAELLGGEIHAASEWGKGSVFTLILPVKGQGKL